MNIGRIFANAIARRVAFVLVAALIAWLGLGDAHAQVGVCANTSDNCTRAQAYAAAREAIRIHDEYDQFPGRQYQTRQNAGTPTSTSGSYVNDTRIPNGSWSQLPGVFRFTSGCPAGQEWNTYTFQCQPNCSSRPSSVQTFLPLTGSKQCYNGCVVTYMQNGDDTTSTRSVTGGVCGNDDFKQNCPTGTFWNGYMSVCQPITPDCPEGQVRQGSECKPENQCPQGMIAVTGSTPGAIQQGSLHCKPAEDTCPQGNVRSPSGQCLPGEGQCATGEARRKDGTCGRDANGDGEADIDDDDDTNDDVKESFSGGDSCNAPPSCSGGPIDCGMARIQWRIDCNTRTKVNVSGGSCGAVPQCVGDNCRAMEYAQLLQQWRAACALEKMADAGAGDGPVGDANKNGVADVLEGRLQPGQPGGDGETTVRSIGVSTSLLDTENIFGGGSCPTPPSFEIMGQAITWNDFPYWCQAMTILRSLVLIFGAYTALRILMGGGI